ncbi:sporulation kinase [Bacillus sp. DNRA2]|uniref:ATP-binding protein n=1 Tax=Bacillus sp. DNRA2 TaxID=2723053 RepID=UPI00145C49B5|nr:ATP-binding protein [Bacillus sp. DNRA2]NMD71319.1 sporulation kinase [Bacillus sp. DNRA2]
MFIHAEIVLYQVLIVLFPILVYHLFFNEKNSERRKPFSKLTIIMLVILCLAMSFPIHFSAGYVYDFRMIPFIIAFLYGGTLPGVIVTIVLIIFRLLIGGAGFYVILTNYTITGIFLILLAKKIKALRKNQKLIFASLVFWTNTVIVVGTLLVQDEVKQIEFMLVFYIITWICLIVVMIIIQNVDQRLILREELQQAEKLNVISQLAASVAHEVRNPMTSVRGFLQLMVDDNHLKTQHKNYIEIAINELDHAQSIINDYLSLARPHTDELSPINISDEVKKTIELMTSYSNIQNITIETAIEDELFIKGNKNEIKQVLVNIIKNGIEAMDIGGTLTVRTYESMGEVKIEIIDSGKGMTKSQLKKLGTPFYTTKEKGTGVGLTISFQLVQAMRGKIKIESEQGKGTTFTLQFPSIAIE